MQNNKKNKTNSMRRILFAGSLTLTTLTFGCDQDEGMSINDLDRGELPNVPENNAVNEIPDVFDPGLKSGVPAIGSKCRKRHTMKEPKNGAGLEYSADCSIAYVLPPIVGTSKVGNFSPSQNLNFCEANNKVAGVAESTVNSAEKMAKRLEDAADKIDELSVEVEAKKLEHSKVSAIVDSGDVEIPRIEAKIEELRLEYKTAKRDLDDCKLDAVDATVECKAQLDAAKAAKKALNEQRDELDKIQLASSKAKVQKKQLEREIEVLETRYNKRIQSHAEIQKLLLDLNRSVMDLYKEYAVLEGALGNIYYMVEWDKVVQDYRDANPDFKGSFAAMPLDEMRFDVRAYVGASSTLPALLGVGVPGVGNLRSQSTELLVSETPVSTDPAPTGFESGSISKAVRGGHSNGANVALSLVGACPAYNEANKSLNKKNLDGVLGAAISYSYQIQARRQYVASYNMGTWIDMMEKIQKKTRPFSSTNLNEVASRAASSEWFSIDFRGNDAEFEYTPKEQEEITKEVANTLQDNAVRQLAHQMGISAPDIPKSELTRTGLQEWSKRKRKGCRWMFYCYVSEYTGRLLSDVWSNKTAIAKFKQSNSVQQVRRVKGTKMVRRYGSSIFMPAEPSSQPSDDVNGHSQAANDSIVEDADTNEELS